MFQNSDVFMTESIFSYEKYVVKPGIVMDNEHRLTNETLSFYIKNEKEYFRMDVDKIKKICDNIDKLYIRKIVFEYLGKKNKYSDIGFVTIEGEELRKITIEEIEKIAKLEIDDEYKKLFDKQVIIQNRQRWEIAVYDKNMCFYRRMAVGIYDNLLITEGEVTKCKT